MLKEKKQENKILKSVIVGCGNVAGGYDIANGRVNTHARAYQLASGIDLVAATDVDSNKAKLFCRKWKLNNFYSDFDEMLQVQKPDVVSVCTPDETHIDILKLCHHHQCVKAVWCEKPIATDIKEAKKIVDIYKEKKIILSTNYVRRWDKNFQKVGEIISQGQLGTISSVVLYYTKGICHNGSHAVDLFLEWFGSLKGCEVFNAHIDFLDRDPTISARVLFGKTPVYILGLDERQYTIFEIDILGSAGRIQINRDGFFFSTVSSDPEYDGYKMLKPDTDLFVENQKDAMLLALESIVGAINGFKKNLDNGERALETLRCCSKIIDSAKGLNI